MSLAKLSHHPLSKTISAYKYKIDNNTKDDSLEKIEINNSEEIK